MISPMMSDGRSGTPLSVARTVPPQHGICLTLIQLDCCGLTFAQRNLKRPRRRFQSSGEWFVPANARQRPILGPELTLEMIRHTDAVLDDEGLKPSKPFTSIRGKPELDVTHCFLHIDGELLKLANSEFETVDLDRILTLTRTDKSPSFTRSVVVLSARQNQASPR
jgi:hypothetical protein